MNIVNEQFFAANKNGNVVEEQASYLKSEAALWIDLWILVSGLAFIAFFIFFESDASVWLLLATTVLCALIWLFFRLPVIYKYYFLALPDARANRLAYATGKLSYDKKYVLQTNEAALLLAGDKTAGLTPGNLYEVCYLPGAKMAISARLAQEASESYQAREFTRLFGLALGFTENDIQANRAGEFTPAQKTTIVKNGWYTILIVFAVIAFALFMTVPMLLDPAFLSDAIFFTVCIGGLAVTLIGVVLLASRDARNLLVLFENKVECAEGIGRLFERTAGTAKSKTTRYYLDIEGVELQIARRAYDALINGSRYRVYYAPRFKYLTSLEALPKQE